VNAVEKAKTNSMYSDSGNQNIKRSPITIPGTNSENHSNELIKTEI
jgi:hypothetical protein